MGIKQTGLAILILQKRGQRPDIFGFPMLLIILTFVLAHSVDSFGRRSQSWVDLDHEVDQIFQFFAVIFLNFLVLTFSNLF